MTFNKQGREVGVRPQFVLGSRIARPIALALATTVAIGGVAVATSDHVAQFGMATASAATLPDSIVTSVSYTLNGLSFSDPVELGISDNDKREELLGDITKGELRLQMEFSIPDSATAEDEYVFNLTGDGLRFFNSNDRTVPVRNDAGIRVADLLVSNGGTRGTLTNFSSDAGTTSRTAALDMELYGWVSSAQQTGKRPIQDWTVGKTEGQVENKVVRYGVAGHPWIISTVQHTWVKSTQTVSHFRSEQDWKINQPPAVDMGALAYAAPLGVVVGHANVVISNNNGAGFRGALVNTTPTTRDVILNFTAADGATLRERSGGGFEDFDVFSEVPRVEETSTRISYSYKNSFEYDEFVAAFPEYDVAAWEPTVVYSADKTTATATFKNIPSDISFSWTGIEALEPFSPGKTFEHKVQGSVGEPAGAFTRDNYFTEGELYKHRHADDLLSGDGLFGPNITDGDGNLPSVDDGKDGDDGSDGSDGRDGVVAIDVVDNADGTVTVTLSDGTTFTLDAGQDGKDGLDGLDGTGLTLESATPDEDGNITYVLSDGTEFTVRNGVDGSDGKDGKDGVNGTDGVDGSDGKGLVEVSRVTNDNGSVTITYEDGSQITTKPTPTNWLSKLLDLLLPLFNLFGLGGGSVISSSK